MEGVCILILQMQVLDTFTKMNLCKAAKTKPLLTVLSVTVWTVSSLSLRDNICCCPITSYLLLTAQFPSQVCYHMDALFSCIPRECFHRILNRPVHSTVCLILSCCLTICPLSHIVIICFYFWTSFLLLPLSCHHLTSCCLTVHMLELMSHFPPTHCRSFSSADFLRLTLVNCSCVWRDLAYLCCCLNLPVLWLSPTFN